MSTRKRKVPEDSQNKEDNKGDMFEAITKCLTERKSVNGIQKTIDVNGFQWKPSGSAKMIKDYKGLPSAGFHISFIGVCVRGGRYDIRDAICQQYFSSENKRSRLTVRKALTMLDNLDVIRDLVGNIEKDFYEYAAKQHPFT